MHNTMTLPGVHLEDDEFLLAIEASGRKEYILTNRRTIVMATAQGTSAELPHEALYLVKPRGFFSAGAWRVMTLGTGGGPKTVLHLFPREEGRYKTLTLRFSMFKQKAMRQFWGNLLTWVLDDVLNIDEAPPVDVNGTLLPVHHELDLCLAGDGVHYSTGMPDTFPEGMLLLTEQSCLYFAERKAGFEGRRLQAIPPYVAMLLSIARRCANTQEFEDEALRICSRLPACKRHRWTDCQDMVFKAGIGMGTLTFQDASSGKEVTLLVKKHSIEIVERYLKKYRSL